MRERHLSMLLKRELEESEVPAKVIAAEVGIPYSTLMNQLNPDIPNAVFKADDLTAFCRATKSRAALHYLADELGCAVKCLDDVVPDKATLPEELWDIVTAAERMKVAMDAERPLVDVGELLEHLIRQGEEAFVKYRSEQAKKGRV